MLPYVNIFGKEIATYGALGLVGILLAAVVVWLLCRRDKKNGLADPNADHLLSAAAAMLAGFLIGSHLLYGITNIPYIVATFSNNPPQNLDQWWTMLQNAFGGMVYFGGLYGTMLGGALVLRKSLKRPVAPYADVCAVGTPLMHAFGRVGCFCSGCCFGVEWEHGFTSHGSRVPACDGVARFPVQLLEASLNLLLFVFLLLAYRKLRGKLMPGSIMRLYLGIYSIIRFSDEFLRGDIYRGVWLGLSTSQWIALATLIGVGIEWCIARKKLRKTES